ncbi:putative ankyrin repeat-containing domain-containing protein [Tanacetum coccineum]|uniref:Ankyrin repeat-containing domain-containing protein n=1 Tax=Tanacetum coccineum TaxID=301880 RepID=A0ABQ5J4V3_9ASTR
MTVFSHTKQQQQQIHPFDYEADVSQRLLDATSSNELHSALDCINDPFIDVNFVGAVTLKLRMAEVICCEELPNVVRFEYQEFKSDVTPLFVAVCNGNVTLVRKLLVGTNIDTKVQLGAWSWDMATGDEFRVGAGLAEPYTITWCAIEYFEASGTILQLLLQHLSPNTYHNGRTLLHHAILCGNIAAVKTLIKFGSHIESPIKTTRKTNSRAIHMAARLGCTSILQHLIDSGCDINSRITNNEETPLMICARFKREECLRVLIKSGADHGLVNTFGQSAPSIAESNKWSSKFQQVVLHVIKSGTMPISTNAAFFSPLKFAAHSGDIQALKVILDTKNIDINDQDRNGFSAVMVTAMQGHVHAFKLLVYAGADVKLVNKNGENAISLSKLHGNSDMFEKVMLQFTLEKGNKNGQGFCPLHCAARHGDIHAVKLLISRGYDVNALDVEGYTPLMLAAKEGNAQMCELLISYGSLCDHTNLKGETALELAREHKMKNVECVILDELARVLVLHGGHVMKHTRGGKGRPHKKMLKMAGSEGVLRWGNSRRRNVVCLEAEVGPSSKFQKRRKVKRDNDTSGIFRVVTAKKKEVHFVCEGGCEMAELWVRGIRLLTMEALIGRFKSRGIKC